jgi:hypothetical protein
LTAQGLTAWKPKYDGPISHFAFNFNLRPYEVDGTHLERVLPQLLLDYAT